MAAAEAAVETYPRHYERQRGQGEATTYRYSADLTTTFPIPHD